MPDHQSPDARNLVLARGVLYAALIDSETQTRGEFFDCGEITALTRGLSDTTIDFISRRTADPRIAAQDTTKREITYKAECNEFVRDLLSLHLMGDKLDLTQTGGDITAEEVCTGVVLGGIYRLANRAVSDVVLHKTSSSGSTLTEGTDYTVINAEVGLIQILGGATAGDAIFADYTAAALTGDTARATIAGGTKSRQELSLIFIGDNARGTNREVDVWRAASSPDGDLPFITADEYGKFSLSFLVLDDSKGLYGGSPTYPLERTVDLP